MIDNMDIYYPVARKEGEGIVIEYYLTPEPEITEPNLCASEMQYNEETLFHTDWLASRQKAMLREDSIDEFKKISGWDNIHPAALLTGIRINSIIHMLELTKPNAEIVPIDFKPFFYISELGQQDNQILEDWDSIFDDWAKKFFTDKENGRYKKQDFVEYLKENYKPVRKDITTNNNNYEQNN